MIQPNNRIMAVKSEGVNLILWILQAGLAGIFLISGFVKSTKSMAELSHAFPWVNDFSVETVRLVGISELLGGLGVILPSILKIKPVLTPIAGLGLAAIMIFAAFYHTSKGEYSNIGLNGILGAAALFIAWGRLKKAPIL